ncbi:hypothetical protein lerEdw1_015924 [Lerista edwardsae]|nr:hypothetical protein lerEdw1_015924 [Lerista edwardsae]
MKLSFGVLFLGWWLDGGLAQNISLTKVKGKIASRRIKQDASYSKPVIFTHPSGVIPLGGNISITCKTDLHVAADFYLWRKGTCTKDFEPTNLNEHDFFISEVQQSDGQIYFCAYCFFGDTDHECSVYSDEINITVRDPSLSEPAILVKPSKDIYPGTKVSFYCQGPETGLTYSLWRAKVLAGTRMAEPDSQIVEFPLFKVKTEDTGNYSCHYQLKGNPFVWSLQSDSIKMIVNGE